MIHSAMTIALLVLVAALPLLSASATDLVERANVWVSAVEPKLTVIDDRWLGPAALHDGRDDTAYTPPSGQPFEILVRFNGSDGQGVRLGRVELAATVGKPVPSEVEFAGCDGPFSDSAATEGNRVVLDLSSCSSSGHLLRLRFGAQPAGFGLTRLAAYSVPMPIPEQPAPLTAAPWKAGIRLHAQSADGAYHLEFERLFKERRAIFTAPPGALSSYDRPPAGRVRYRVRAVGHDGATGPWSEPLSVDFAPASSSPIAIRGVVEGFYGRPWTWDERLDSVRLMAALGMNTYLYAPKDDPLHRETWRDPYPAMAMARFGELLEIGRDHGVDVYYTISPGLSMDPAAAADFSDLTAKLVPFLGLGYRHFGLLLDDIKAPKSASTGRLHSALANRLHDWLKKRDARLMFVGTVYAGTAETLAPNRLSYVKALAAIHDDVEIMWTGEGVFDADMSPAHIRGIGELLGRKPLIWDNYPVNDFYFGSQRLFLGPVTGRGKALPQVVSGVLSNPMTHEVSSRPALMSYGDYFADPANYSPVFTLSDLGTVVEGDWGDGSLELFIEDHLGSPKMLPGAKDHPELEGLAASLLKAGGGTDPAVTGAAAWELASRLAERYVADGNLWQHCHRAGFADEIWGPVAKRRVQLEVALAAIGALASPQHHGLVTAARELVRLHVAGELGWSWFGLDSVVAMLQEELGSRILAKDDKLPGFPDNLPPLPDEVDAATCLCLDLAPPPGTTVQVFAAGEARVADGRLHWQPLEPGYARLVLLYRGDGLTWPRVYRPFVHECGNN